MSLEYLSMSIRNSMQNSLEEEAHIPLESLLTSIRNSIRNALTEEAQIPLESLISIRNSRQHALEEESSNWPIRVLHLVSSRSLACPPFVLAGRQRLSRCNPSHLPRGGASGQAARSAPVCRTNKTTT
jgi:hypothetical protein